MSLDVFWDIGCVRAAQSRCLEMVEKAVFDPMSVLADCADVVKGEGDKLE